jgi:hypothetical protein
MCAFSNLTERDLQRDYAGRVEMFSDKVMLGGALVLACGILLGSA